ncbi:MAG: hypothetical protein K1X53_06100 [Candidatus Sumerlaeaceae bacterium]|nr:hypothetical protein [Candidatus Sumerlaeaceae bacterium]
MPDRVRKWVFASCTVAGIVLAAGPSVRADHALLQDGRAVFNVVVIEDTTTWSRPLEIRTKPESFLYDFSRNKVQPLLERSKRFWVAEVIKTGETMGKPEARQFFKGRNWVNFEPPPTVVVVPPPPEPEPGAAATVVATPLPKEVASEKLPLERRIVEQMRIFRDEQEDLVNALRLSLSAKTVDEKQARDLRVRLLGRQAQIMKDHFPVEETIVQNALKAMDENAKSVEETGRFKNEF